jgi:tetratricopeptide (TPR) repeat protein
VLDQPKDEEPSDISEDDLLDAASEAVALLSDEGLLGDDAGDADGFDLDDAAKTAYSEPPMEISESDVEMVSEADILTNAGSNAPVSALDSSHDLPDEFQQDDMGFDGEATVVASGQEISAMTVQGGGAAELDEDALSQDALDAMNAAAADGLDDGKSEQVGLSSPMASHGFEDDPAAAFFPDELEEAEFFIEQEIYDEAKDIIVNILEDVPDSPRAKHMLARIEAREAGEPEPLAPWQEQILDEVEDALDDFDLGEETASPMDDLQVSMEEVLSQFKEGVAKAVSDDDADTHFDLGIAYREMGLSSEAISEFQLAANSSGKAADAKHMVGLCQVDTGAFDDALATFDEVLAMDGLPDKQRAANSYQRGVCLEELSRFDEAISAFEEAQGLDSKLADVAARIANAESKRGSQGGATRGKNIGYV